MLAEVLSFVVGELNQYLRLVDTTLDESSRAARLGNIAHIDHPEVGIGLSNHLVLTQVNVEEESSLKNQKAAHHEGTGDLVYRNPPLHLNLYLLFTANYSNYETALKRLGQVLTFFQGKRKFTSGNCPEASARLPFAELSLTLDLLSLGLEEVNHLWGSLGGKQLPFAMYRGRLAVLQAERPLAGGAEIREIRIEGPGSMG